MFVRLTIETEVTGCHPEWLQKLMREKANAIKIAPDAFVAAPKGIGQEYNDDLEKPFEVLDMDID